MGRCTPGARGLKIRILSVGRDRSGLFEPGVLEYATRVRRYASLELLELPGAKKGTAELRREAEGEEILSRLRPGEKLIALDEKGQSLTSLQLAEKLWRANAEQAQWAVVLGGDEGLDPKVLKEAWLVLSLSRMTLPHRLARLVFAEQLYRAFTLVNREPYHK